MTDSALFDHLADRYGEERVSTRPNGVAVDDADGRERLLVARETESTDPLSLEAELDVLTDAVADQNATFGVLVAPEIEYVFEPTSRGPLDFESTLPALPDDESGTRAGTRPFNSVDELLLCFYRAYNTELPAETMSIDDRREKFAETVSALDSQRAGDHDAETELEHVVGGVFAGFDLDATDRSTLSAFVERVSETDSILRYCTRMEVADFLVELAGVEASDTVLDPAAGIGTIVRSAAETGAEVTGVEIDSSLADVSRFFLDLLDLDADVVTADYLEYDDVPQGIDYVLLEPPATRGTADGDLGSLVTTEGEHIEEQILREAAESVDSDARLFAFVPFGMLIRPDESARELRSHLRENYRIETLLEVVNPAYYPYPGVRTAVVELAPDDDPNDYEVDVALLEAATDASRFGTTGEKDLDVLFEETLADIRSGDIEQVPISAFGEALSPSAVLRRREMAEMLREAYSETASVEDIAADIEAGQEIPWRELGAEGLPYVRIANVTGHASEQRHVPESDAEVVATSSDLLVSIEGTVGELYVPDEPVVPGPEWAVVRLGSADAALVYESFFDTSTGEKQQEALRESAIVPYPRYTPWLPLRRLRRLVLPVFTQDERGRLADAVRELGPAPSQDRLDEQFSQQ